MEVECCVPPGFRFHPTEEELVGYYLTRKITSQKIDLGVINDIDLYRIEPWDLQERCKHGYEEQNEWYFFSHKDKKYPSGTRTNRATNAGFWKATGRDKAVLSKSKVIGMRKTLVFYEGRAPNGRKSDWIMHEYRLQSGEHAPPQEEGWVVCRAFKKPTPNPRPIYNTYSSPYYVRDHDYMLEQLQEVTRPTRIMESNPGANFYESALGLVENEPKLPCGIFEIPRLDSPSMSTNLANSSDCFDASSMTNKGEHIGEKYDARAQFVDWKVLDKLLASQLSESASGSNSNLPMAPLEYDINDPNQDDDQFLASFRS
ncbi:uncharacterized protein A4U43_C09F7830 [Asparagus officinalis]|uniref:NAC domain-containing protein n=1 Tax=Asparagus officinalis TaxID=4686 RepID=A0A5P1E7S7_ASPOF|nr:NAC domain-containing protein 105-like [Asparagus officinalis]ONK58073.1 uncharacterized protein A4U43_C09F7830 [Asparagus officinalis]